MNKIQELIEKLCPDGVEYKRIGDIANVLRGKRLTKDKLNADNGYPVYHGGLEPLGYYHEMNRKANTVMVINVGASAGTVGFCDVDFWSSDGCYCISHNDFAIPKYIYSALASQEQLLVSKVRRAGIPTLDAKIVEDIKIPVPPLEVQSEIVRILDNFTELTSELTSELTARKKQYEHYRDELLTFRNGMETKTHKLCEICEVYDGTHQTPNYTDYGIKFASVENIQAPYNTTKHISVEDYNKYKIKPRIDDVLMTRIGSIGTCYVIDRTEDLAYYVSLALLRPNTSIINSRYLKHYIESIKGAKELRRRTLVNAVPIKINKDDIGKINITFPALEEQQRIVDILDRFDKLCNDISEGLPAEIEARQKQYEYYRDKLLTFKEKA